MKHPFALLLGLALASGCHPTQNADPGLTLAVARAGFHTKLLPAAGERTPVEPPPAGVLDVVAYPAPVGRLAAYLSPDPHDGRRHPAIVWLTGGDCNTIGDVWTPAPADNDQTAAAYRQAGLVMLYPSLRGGNDNPGTKEGFLGEVNDVLAATDYLKKLPYVDPQRIYLGGHSTGGTLALLVAECAEAGRYRAVFAFGPAAEAADYGDDAALLPFDQAAPRELELRSPLRWLNSSVRGPVWLFEGTTQANSDALQALAEASTNPHVHCVPVRGATHFSTLGPTNRLIARKILADTGAAGPTFTEEEVGRNFAAQ